MSLPKYYLYLLSYEMNYFNSTVRAATLFAKHSIMGAFNSGDSYTSHSVCITDCSCGKHVYHRWLSKQTVSQMNIHNIKKS